MEKKFVVFKSIKIKFFFVFNFGIMESKNTIDYLLKPSVKKNSKFKQEYPFPIVTSECKENESDPSFKIAVGYLQDNCVLVHDEASMKMLYCMVQYFNFFCYRIFSFLFRAFLRMVRYFVNLILKYSFAPCVYLLPFNLVNFKIS